MKKAYLECIVSMLIFGTIGIIRRYIPFSSTFLAFIRGILGGTYLLVYIKITKRGINTIKGRALPIIILTGVVIGLNWVFLFESYNYTSVSAATMCYYMQPTFVMLLSPIFLKEKLTIKKGLCAVISLIGMLFVSGVLSEKRITTSDTKGIFYALIAALLYASVIILNKKTDSIDAYMKTAIELLSASGAILPYLLLTEDISKISFSVSSLILVLTVGILHTGIAYTMYFGSMKSLSAQSTALISYVDPVSALILSNFLLNENIGLLGWLGATAIIISAIISIRLGNNHISCKDSNNA